MNIKVLLLLVLCTTVSCSAPVIVEMPAIPGPPSDWERFSSATGWQSDCPDLEGLYSEPPIVYRSGKRKRFVPSDNFDLYSSYIPSHLGDRSVLRTDSTQILVDVFEIKQPDSAEFLLVYKNGPADEIVQVRFRQSEGDFECEDGTVRFPEYQVSGMIEGTSTNFQIRNVLLKDVGGALIIQSTRGPYRGYSRELEDKFTYEFIRYPKFD